MDTKIFSAILTLAIGFIAAGIATVIVRWLKNKAAGTSSKLDDIFFSAVGKPLVITIIALAAYIALTRYEILPESVAGFSVDQYMNAFFIVVCAWIVSSFASSVMRTYGSQIAEKTDPEFDVRLIPMFENSVRYLVWFIAFLMMLGNFQIDITPLLAGAGIAGIALALAAQEILSNFLGGAIITVDKPFRIGDRIKIDTFFGDIVYIGARSTRMKTMDNQIVTIPNSRIISQVVTNYALPDPTLKVRIPFSVAYGTNMPAVKKILLEIAREAAEKTPWVAAEPGPSVYFLEFGESGQNGQLILWAKNYDNAWDVRDYVNMRIDERFRTEGIEIPYRQVDVRMREQEDP